MFLELIYDGAGLFGPEVVLDLVAAGLVRLLIEGARRFYIYITATIDIWCDIGTCEVKGRRVLFIDGDGIITDVDVLARAVPQRCMFCVLQTISLPELAILNV